MKWIEEIIRKFVFLLFRIIFRNQQASLPLDSTKIKKILILRYDVLGDMIVTTPVFNLLKEKLPEVEIHVLGSKRNIGLLAHDKRISKILCYNGTLKSLLKIRRIGKKEKYDLIFPMVFYKTTNSGLWANWVGGKKAIKVVWANPWRSHFYKYLFNLQIPSDDKTFLSLSMSDILVKFVSASFGWQFTKGLSKIKIELAYKHELYAKKMFEQFNNRKILLINLSVGHPSREMLEGTVKLLISKILANNSEIIILLNAIPIDLYKAKYLCEIFPDSVHILPHSSDILNFCACINLCDIIISPDTSLIHMATAFDKPIVGLYKNSEKHCKEWGPQHEKAVIIVPDGEKNVSEIEYTSIYEAFNTLNKKYSIL
ncbi:MAG: glycosyltransferase family 9 protein [Bacteroidetes bacterium]|nr:glycosyltransferase family 9 protein [Bacteroidota bacterium]